MQSFKEAQLSFEKSEFLEAEKKYTKFLSEVSKDQIGDRLREEISQAYNNRGQIKYLRVDFKEAIEDYTQAIKTKPNFYVAFYNRGQIQYRLGRYSLAIKDFETTLSINPDFSDAKTAIKTAKLEQSINGDRYWPS